MTFRPYADNVVLTLEPIETTTASGIALVPHKPKHRTARVVFSGAGFWTRLNAFIPNESEPGQRVIVDALAGQNYDLDLTIPRHNKLSEFEELFGEKGEFRIVRQDDILGTIVE
jgi:co-chaperonin GroES (HSP10)